MENFCTYQPHHPRNFILNNPQALTVAATVVVLTPESPAISDDGRRTAWQVLVHNRARARHLGIPFGQLLAQARQHVALRADHGQGGAA